MTLESWTPPNAVTDTAPDQTTLNALLHLSTQLDQLPDCISPQQQLDWRRLMTLPKAVWQATGEQLSIDQTLALIRFFTLAEEKVPHWQAGADSPVIGLVKSLRTRKHPPTTELLQWIKANSSNRYLPNGPLL